MGKAVTIAVWLGVGALIAAAAIIGGIVVNVLNDGENHKEAMMRSPPPSPPPARREMEELVHPKGSHFEFNKAERALFTNAAHRERANAKLHR
jgi:hypothetical protein